MRYKKLGNSDIEVSQLCLGCMSFGKTDEHADGWTLNEADSRAIIQHALDVGINFFDTAMVYSDGVSEEFLGRAIKDMAKREDVVIATKFMPRTAEDIAANVSGQEHVAKCLDASLARLGMDYVDLYICHMWDYHTPIEELMEGLNTAVQSGKVRAIGISNCFAWQLAKANHIAETNGWPKFVSIQGHYNLLFREEEREMAPYCADANITMTPYSPLASGRLSKPRNVASARLEKDAVAKSKYDATEAVDDLIVQRVIEVAERKGVTRTQIALAWLMQKGAVPLIGATKLHYIDDAIGAMTVTLTAEEMAYLEELYVPHALVGVMEYNK